LSLNSLNLPNIVTLARIILVPVIFWLLISGNKQAAFIAFLAAGVSDAVDGFLAKRFNWQTQLGAYLDPIADKLLIVSIYVALGVAEHLPSWLAIAVVSRDILIVLAVMLAWFIGNPVAIEPSMLSKTNTAFQIALAAAVLAAEGFSIDVPTLRTTLVWITGMLTVASLADYLRTWLSHMSGPTAQSGG